MKRRRPTAAAAAAASSSAASRAAPPPVLDAGGAVVLVSRPVAPAPSAGPSASAGPELRFRGCAQLRLRIVAATLARRPLRIDGIRGGASASPGLDASEASFLRLVVERLTNGGRLAINDTGTALRYAPGALVGGAVEHDCGTGRSLGWFIEGVLPLLPFCRAPAVLTLSGVSSDVADWGVDALRGAVLPFAAQFGLAAGAAGGLSLDVLSRGAPPLGGARVRLSCPVVRELASISITDEGLVRKVRGVAYACKVSPQMANRLAASAK